MYAIYARQSVDRPDSISIESQIEYCKYETKGEEYREYIDRGYSGKNTDRPMFQELLADIEKGRITKVIVYKLDRISRSILDFSNLMETLQKYKVEFISSTEKFDTSTPMGRAALNICIVFAQLERETIQKRVADAYHSRSMKSLYMGGRVPYGYRLTDTTIDGIKTSKYEIYPTEAEVIRLMYELYAKPYTSYGDILDYFLLHGITNRGRPWNRARIGEHLKNPIYVRADEAVYVYYYRLGTRFVNDPSDFIGINGCYYYKKKEEQGDYLVLAPHEGIVSSALWLQCRNKAVKNRQMQPVTISKKSWLTGKVKCNICGYAMVLKQYSGHRYFLCSHRLNSKACAGTGTIYGDELEDIIHREMQEKLKNIELLTKEHNLSDQKSYTRLKAELLRINNEINSLLDRLPDANVILMDYINNRINQLHQEYQAKHKEIEDITCERLRGSGRTGIPPDISNWENIDYNDKRSIADLLIKVIRVTDHTVDIFWRF